MTGSTNGSRASTTQAFKIRRENNKNGFMLPSRCFYGKRPFQPQRSRCHLHPFSTDRHKEQGHLLGPVKTSQSVLQLEILERSRTSIRQKLGVGSSPSGHHTELIAPVALPGLTKNFPSNSYASNLCVPPQRSTSTSMCLAAISRLSASPGGIIVWP